jgi:hypothetical protein
MALEASGDSDILEQQANEALMPHRKYTGSTASVLIFSSPYVYSQCAPAIRLLLQPVADLDPRRVRLAPNARYCSATDLPALQERPERRVPHYPS